MANPVIEGGYASPYSIYDATTFDSKAETGHPVGTRGVLDDRSFRWVRFMDSTAIGPNKLAAAAAPVAAHVSESNSAFTAGTTRVDFTPGATIVYEDQYRDGYIKVEGGTLGIGQMYKLRSHGYKDLSVATTFDLYDPVQTTTTGSEVMSLIANPWSSIVIAPTTAVSMVVGVTMTNFAVAETATTETNGYLQTAGTVAAPTTRTKPRYGWVQTWGIASVLLDTSALVAGSSVIYGATAGAVGVAVETDIKQRIGIAMEAMTTDNIYSTVFLQIAP